MRELKEETGIKLDKDEVKNSPWLDLLQTDNFNPHKGTCSGKMASYFQLLRAVYNKPVIPKCQLNQFTVLSNTLKPQSSHHHSNASAGNTAQQIQ